MAIRPYESNGKTCFEVDVRLRSKIDPSLRPQRCRRGIESLAEAKKLHEKLELELLREIVTREKAGCTWKQLISDWAQALHDGKGSERSLQRSTVQDILTALEAFTSVWIHIPAADITRADVKQVLDGMKEQGYSKSRQRAVKSAVNGAFTWGIDTRRIKGVSVSPAVGISLTHDEEKKPEILTLGEAKKLLEAAEKLTHPWYPVWAMALLTGMRSGELNALEWTDVDWENKRITVSKSYNGRLKSVKSTKGGYWREVPINEDLELLLKELRAKAPKQKHVLPRLPGWDRGEAARVLRQFCQGIGLPSVRFHALRACFGTLLLRQRVAPVTVMKLAGWKDLKTMQRYIRLAGIEIDGATDELKLITPREAMGTVVPLFKTTTGSDSG